MPLFYVSASLACVATLLVISSARAIHALLYLIASLLAVAVCFFTLGAPLAGVLEIILYAGAIVVLFVFVVMLLHRDPEATEEERRQFPPSAWVGPILLIVPLLVVIALALRDAVVDRIPNSAVTPRAVGTELFGPYVLVVQIAGLLLLAGLLAAHHLSEDDDEEESGGTW